MPYPIQLVIHLSKIETAMLNRQWIRSTMCKFRNRSSTVAIKGQSSKWMVMQKESKVSFLNSIRAEIHLWLVVNLKLTQCQKIRRTHFKCSRLQRIMRVRVICQAGLGVVVIVIPAEIVLRVSPSYFKKSIWKLRLRIMKTRLVKGRLGKRLHLHQPQRRTIWNRHYKLKRSSKLWSLVLR